MSGKVYIVCFCVSKVETGDRVPQEHETPAIAIGMAGITNSAFLIQGKTCAQRGKVITEPSVLWDPFNVLFYLSQVGPKFEIHMGLPDSLRSRNQPAESHLVQGQFGVLIVRNLILLLTQSCTNRKSTRKRMPFSCYDHCSGCHPLLR